MRLRITYSKTGSMRYVGHLDLQSTWERTIRRAGLPLAYTHGFHPGPKIQIASALPLGFLGRAEIVDIWLDEPAGANLPFSPDAVTNVSLEADLCVRPDTYPNASVGSDLCVHPLQDRLQTAASPGLTIISLEQVDASGPALQTQVASAEYEVTLLDPMDETELARHLSDALKVASLPRERRGKAYDLRPLVEELSILPTGEGQEMRLFMRLAARQGATGRPEEVLAVLGIPFESTRIERTRLILKNAIE